MLGVALDVMLGVVATAGGVATIGERTGGEAEVTESAGEETIGLYGRLRCSKEDQRAHVRVSEMSLVVRR